MSAFEIFKDLEMQEESVECLFISGRTTQAEALVRTSNNICRRKKYWKRKKFLPFIAY